MYHIPRMMVPVRTWQQRQQLVEYHRSHGEIIILDECGVQAISWMLPKNEKYLMRLCPGKKNKQHRSSLRPQC